MKLSVRFALASVMILGLLLSGGTAWAQTANTGIVLGTVTDPGGAMVPEAAVKLTHTATNVERGTTTNAAGQFTFPGVAPGTYKVTVTKSGFATFVVANLTVDVNKSYTVDVKLEIRSSNEIVEVSAGAQAELQTTDAVVGNVVGGQMLTRLPTLNRDATELLTLQPGSTPYDATGFGNNGGTIAGARSDQNTITLDGIDVTDNVIAGGANEQPIIPAAVESMDEFRVGVTNANATFGRSAGGQVTLVSHSGTNEFHGSGYWFHQNDDLNANTWENNHTPDGKGHSFTPRPEQRDNRGGISFGGPIKHDKTFFFGNYEIRRFFQALQFTRLVPSSTLKQGILTFGGIPYNLANSMACGSSGNLACDPRGLGISPTVQALWNLMPNGNDNTVPGADGVNILGLRGTVPAPRKDDSVSFKLDHNFTSKIHFFGRWSYFRDLTPNGGQIDLRGSAAANPSDSDIRGDSSIGGLDWQIRPNLLNTFRGGWVRSRQDFTVIRPSTSSAQLNLPGTASSASPTGFIALAPGLATGSGFLDTVVDVDTQRARHQAIYDSNKQYTDFLTWTKGKHTIVGGGEGRWLPTIHDRDDKVIGSLNSLVAALDGDHNFGIPGANRPPGLSAGDVARWDRLYAASLGLVDNVGILTASDGNLNPLPFGSTLVAHATLQSFDFFFQDTWRMSPSFTMTYGLSYGWQTTPHERDGKQTFLVDAGNGNKILTAKDFLDAKEAAAANGDFYNPTFGYLPIKNSGRSNIFNVDYGDFAPRFSIAWNPSYRDGFLGRVLGERKTVIRSGYGIAYDRINTVGSVIIPMLGVGFAQTLSVVGPACSASGAGGTKCGVDTTPGGSIFRVGVDGAIPTPAPLGKQVSPVTPSAPFSEILSFSDDPDSKVGRNHMIDFTIQREMRGNMLLEVGYIGRLARDLLNNVNFDSSPIFFKDKTSGQTFAQAYDALSAQVRGGISPFLPNGNPNPAFKTQPWFDNLVPLGACQAFLGVASAATTSGCIAQGDTGDFTGFNVSDLFLNMDIMRGLFSGLPTFNNLNIIDLFVRTHRDLSNYHAVFFALHNRGWHALQWDANYTFSKSLDQIGTVQNSASYYASSFNPAFEYGPSFFDRAHVFNLTYNYDLPFGRGHFLSSSSHDWLNKVMGGWYTSGIFRANSGAPLTVVEGQSGSSLGGGLIFGFPQAAIPVTIPSTFGGGLHSGVCAGPGNPGSTGDGPNCSSSYPSGTTLSGTGLNYFGNPTMAINDFRPILLASDGRTGRSRPLRGFGLWNLDMRIGKETKFRERYSLEYSFAFFNIFNHVNFQDPTLDLTNLPTFGVVSQSLTPANRNASSRWIQFGLRANF